jgi:2-dehydropantoate 2-reductase
MAQIAILGAGGVGGFVAATLARAGQDVVVIARPPTAELISQSGVTVRSTALGAEFTARPAAVGRLTAAVDFLLVATKATGLDAALERIESAPRLVLPLLNGLDHIDRLRGRFGAERVAAGVIRIESDRPQAGLIVQTSPSCRVDMATSQAALAPALERLAAVLAAAGIPAQIGTSESQVLWSKLARLCALALTTSASDRPIGFVRSDPRWRSALVGAVNETVAVANADGASLQASDTLAELDQAHAGLGSSMQRDIAAGREPELDAIGGGVLRAGARHGLRCPTVQWLTARVATRAGPGR